MSTANPAVRWMLESYQPAARAWWGGVFAHYPGIEQSISVAEEDASCPRELRTHDAPGLFRLVFKAEARRWRGYRSFIRAGGVPGCRVPANEEGLIGFVIPDYQNAAYLAARVIGDAQRALSGLREADESYSPDY